MLAAIPFQDLRGGAGIANGVAYGLTASIFTRDLATAHRFARDVQAGYVWINDASVHFPGTDFGGVKDRAWGAKRASAS